MRAFIHSFSMKGNNLNMKRLTIMAAALLCLIAPLTGLALSEQEARELAQKALVNQEGLKEQDLVYEQTGRYEDSPDVLVVFYHKGHDPLNDGMYGVRLTPGGQVAAITPPREMHPAEQLRRDVKDPPYDSLRMMALQAKWRDSLPRFLTGELGDDAPECPADLRTAVLARALSQEISLPGADALTEEAARKLAEAAILGSPPWTREQLDAFDLYLSVHYRSEELGRPVWQFIFSRKSPMSPEFAQRPEGWYHKNYLEPLVTSFGGTQNTPLFVSVRLVAITGELAEEVHTHYPPQRALPLAMIK